MRVQRWESKILRLTLKPKMKAGEGWVDYRIRTSREVRTKWRKMVLPSMADKNAENVWKIMAWDGGIGVLLSLWSRLRMRKWRSSFHEGDEDDEEIGDKEEKGRVVQSLEPMLSPPAW